MFAFDSTETRSSEIPKSSLAWYIQRTHVIIYLYKNNTTHAQHI